MLKKLALIIAAALSVPASAYAENVTLIFSNVTNKSSVDTAQILIDTAAKASNGVLKINHYPNNMLGDDRTVTESTLIGDIDLVQTQPSISILTSMVPDLYVWDAPFLFENADEAWKCMDSNLGQTINNQVEKHGLKYLASLENGYRNYTNNKVPVRVPADIKGQKLRVMETDLQIAMWKNWGANPTPMASTEVVSALQQGTIDSQENALAVFEAQRLYEIQHYISKTGHMFSPHNLYMNKEKFEELGPDLQKALMEAVFAYQSAQRKHASELNEHSYETFRKAGCEVIELTQDERNKWRQMAIDGGIYDMIRKKMTHPEYLDKILNKEY